MCLTVAPEVELTRTIAGVLPPLDVGMKGFRVSLVGLTSGNDFAETRIASYD